MTTRRSKSTSSATLLVSTPKRPSVRRANSSGSVVSVAAAASASSSSSSSSSSTATALSAASASSTAGSAASSGNKLRANRERRRRERARNRDDDELEQKFSGLSVSAPVFTPASMRAAPSSPSPMNSSTVSAPTASWLAKTKPTSPQPRRVPPAHQRLQQQQQQQQSQQQTGILPPGSTTVNKTPKPMSQWGAPSPSSAVSADSAATSDSSSAAKPERRPRRQRIGALGFSKRKSPSSNSVVTTATTPSAFRSSGAFQLSASADNDASTVTTRQRSNSTGSDSEYSSDDEVFPDDAAPSSSVSAFPERLTFLGQQKKVPKNVVSRDAVIDTVFAALFSSRDKTNNSDSTRTRFSAFGDDDEDTGTDTDEPNEDFVKRGLAATLFKDSLQGDMTLPTGSIRSKNGRLSNSDAVDRFVTPSFIHTLVTDLRFEDFRTASARIAILRAIHKSCPSKRVHIARALADAAALRFQYVVALLQHAHGREIEKSKVMVDHPNDHSHGFTELLRYGIEHVGETLNGITGETADASMISQGDVDEIVRGYLLALISLWKTHWYDPAGSDDEELISCAGQFVAYIPHVASDLLRRLLRCWPTRFPTQEIVAIRMIARVIMTSPPLHSIDGAEELPIQIFTRLAKCITSPHTQVAQEALAFTGCQFAMVHFLGEYEDVYKVISEAFHQNATSHWNEVIRTTSEGHFDRALDYAP